MPAVAINRSFLAPPTPNPASSGTQFEFVIGVNEAAGGRIPVVLTIHDVQGRLVRALYEGLHGAGRYATQWDTRDESGRPVAVGLYYLRFRAGGVTGQEKVLIMR